MIKMFLNIFLSNGVIAINNIDNIQLYINLNCDNINYRYIELNNKLFLCFNFYARVLQFIDIKYC